jgi:hypothetical protein
MEPETADMANLPNTLDHREFLIEILYEKYTISNIVLYYEHMASARTIAVLVLTLVFVLCMPMHILSASLQTEHNATHHMGETTAHTIVPLFSHAAEMTNTPWIAMLIIILGAFVFWFRAEYLLDFYRTQSPTPQTFFNTVFTDSGGVFRWIMFHRTSPPQIV